MSFRVRTLPYVHGEVIKMRHFADLFPASRRVVNRRSKVLSNREKFDLRWRAEAISLPARVQRILPFVLLLFLPVAARADGMVVPTIAYPAKVTIPDQRALICFSNGVERLVIETRFTGSGTNFAWVVPLPRQPVIEEATTGLFPTLQYLFRPEIVHDVPKHYAWIIALAWLIYVLGSVRPTGRVTLLDLVSCLLVGTGIATLGDRDEFVWVAWLTLGFIVFLDLLFLVNLVRFWNGLPRSLGGIMLGFFLLLQLPVLIALLVEALPMLCIVLFIDAALVMALIKSWENASRKVATAIFISLVTFQFLLFVASFGATKSRAMSMSSAASSSPQVSILDRRIVGIFETTTLAARDAKELQTWLAENGYATPTDASPVIADYVRDGWVFVATKVRRDRPDNATSTPHPLSFTFKTDKPVYPIRLTGVDNGPLSVELYVFGTVRAKNALFKLDRCTRQRMVHPLLAQWTAGLPVATKLSATLSPATMHRDVWLESAPFRTEHQNRLYSRWGAFFTALNWGTGLLAAGLVTACLLAFAGEKHKNRMPRRIGIAAAAGVVLAGLVYFCLPKIEVKLTRGFSYSFLRMEQIALRLAWDDENWQTLAQARAGFKELIANPTNAVHLGLKNWDNDYVGGQIREEDSPGNYLLRETNNQLQLVFFHPDGMEEITETWELPAQR
jgi:hypothetical protein